MLTTGEAPVYLRRTSVDGPGLRPVRVHEKRQQPSSTVCWGLRECQHYPPSWVEATTSLDQVVSGSATPAGASQWDSCRTGSRAFAPGSRGYTRLMRNWEQTSALPIEAAQTHSLSAPTNFRVGRSL
jgi:hypothetical protein